MDSYRIEVFGHPPHAQLRLFGPDGKLIDDRPLPADAEAFALTIQNRYEGPAPNHAQLGRELYAWLDDPARRWFSRMPVTNAGLALHLGLDSRLANLPWELLHDGQTHWAARAQGLATPVRRLTPHLPAAAAVKNRPLRVLFMAAAPEGGGAALSYEREEALILAATKKQPLELVVEETGSLEGLEYRLSAVENGWYDVVHLTGHADVVDGVPVMQLEDEFGKPQLVGAEAIAKALAGNWPRLLFLSACKTGQASDRRALPSLAEALVRAGSPALLGWALPVGDESASRLAAELYRWLALGRGIDEAVARSRLVLCQQQSSFWHMLRLYADDTPLTPLVTTPDAKNRDPITTRAAAAVFLDALGTRPVCDRSQFVGRRRPLQRGLRVLRATQADEHYQPGVLIHGMGGLGKSSLAARFCERLERHLRLVCVGPLDETKLLAVISQQLEDADAIQKLGDGQLPLATRLRVLLRDGLGNRPALFILDDFEQNAELDEAGHPRLDGDSHLRVQAEALRVLRDLTTAIRASNSVSRVIVTCRYDLPAELTLARLPLDGLKGADLEKKVDLLPAFQRAEQDTKILAQAERLSGGNPRLLERLAKVLGETKTDAERVLGQLEGVAQDFREETLLRILLDHQGSEARRWLARLSVFRVPVDEPVVSALAPSAESLEQLARAVAAGLVERIDRGQGEPRWLVSPLVAPLVQDELTPDERAQATRAAALAAYQHWWQADQNYVASSWDEYCEIHRLALEAHEQPVAAEVGDVLATHLVNTHCYRQALLLCEVTRALGEDPRLLHTQARAEVVLGNTKAAAEHYDEALRRSPLPVDADEGARREYSALLHNRAQLAAQQGDIPRALELWKESLELKEQIGDVRGKSATLHNMAGVIAQQGDIPRALDLWNESLALDEQLGDVQGKAATLNNMAGVIAQRGDIRRALDLWNDALQILEQIGDVQGKAATLHNMAGVIARQGNIPRALELWEESLKLKEQIGDVGGKAATLNNMAGVVAQQGDIRRALDLWNESLALKEQIGDVQGKAATLHNMAGVIAQQGDIPRALDLWNESLALDEQLGDVRGKAATLHSMAGVIAQQGEVSRALDLWNDSLALKEQLGDVQGKAATLNNMARVIAQQGEIPRALDLWNESLQILEQIGDVQGKAATLANMAWAAGQQGDQARAHQLNLDAARALAQVRAWLDLITVLGNLGMGDQAGSAGFLAQALWLVLRVTTPVDNSVTTAAALLEKLGADAPVAPALAGAGAFLLRTRGSQHPKRAQLAELCLRMLEDCASARNVAPEAAGEWIERERIPDPEWWVPRLDEALVELVGGDDQWLFDRRLVDPA